MSETLARMHLRRHLEAHLIELGYSGIRPKRPGLPVPEVVRVSPVRGRIVYGETVLRSDLKRTTCHERLLSFSQRRTRRRSSILFFIGVAEVDLTALEELLATLEIRSGSRGGHVHVIPVPPAEEKRQRATATAPRRKASSAA